MSKAAELLHTQPSSWRGDALCADLVGVQAYPAAKVSPGGRCWALRLDPFLRGAAKELKQGREGEQLKELKQGREGSWVQALVKFFSFSFLLFF